MFCKIIRDFLRKFSNLIIIRKLFSEINCKFHYMHTAFQPSENIQAWKKICGYASSWHHLNLRISYIWILQNPNVFGYDLSEVKATHFCRQWRNHIAILPIATISKLTLYVSLPPTCNVFHSQIEFYASWYECYTTKTQMYPKCENYFIKTRHLQNIHTLRFSIRLANSFTVYGFMLLVVVCGGWKWWQLYSFGMLMKLGFMLQLKRMAPYLEIKGMAMLFQFQKFPATIRP